MDTWPDRIVSGPSLQGDIPPSTIPQFVRERARRHPQAVALVDGPSGRSLSYAELDRRIGRCAAGLAARGFAPGDTLLLFSPNSPEWVVAALGAMAAGGRVSGANPSYTVAELAQQMRDAGARFAFTIPALLATVQQAAVQASCAQLIVAGAADGAIAFDTVLACEDAEPAIADDPDAIALLPYSSGTTGVPKGVMLTHRAIVSNVHQTLQATGWPEGLTMLAFLPMFHAMGFALTTLSGLALGGKLVTLPRFEPASFLGTIAEHRVTHMVVVPPVMQFLAAHPMVETCDLTSLRQVVGGGAPMGAALEDRVSARLKCPVWQGYGMTEVTAVLCCSHDAARRAGSVGHALPATQARVVDPATGEDLPRGQEGELWFRGPQLFLGYLNRPEATAATLTPEGWIRTGDIGRIDEDGFVFITDRLKELIKFKGLQVAPAELEALLLTHPGVADAAVIGRPDERAGEVPVAYVVPRGALDVEALKSWLAQRVAPHKHLADAIACEAIPKNPSGKLLRRVLRERDAERLRVARASA